MGPIIGTRIFYRLRIKEAAEKLQQDLNFTESEIKQEEPDEIKLKKQRRRQVERVNPCSHRKRQRRHLMAAVDVACAV